MWLTDDFWIVNRSDELNGLEVKRNGKVKAEFNENIADCINGKIWTIWFPYFQQSERICTPLYSNLVFWKRHYGNRSFVFIILALFCPICHESDQSKTHENIKDIFNYPYFSDN